VLVLAVWSGHVTAGSGWYLMWPPDDARLPNQGPDGPWLWPDEAAEERARLLRVTPLSRWQHRKGYDTHGECEIDLWRMQDSRREKFWAAAEPGSQLAFMRKIYAVNLVGSFLAFCVASDDARLR
jgi:hypothetical protein